MSRAALSRCALSRRSPTWSARTPSPRSTPTLECPYSLLRKPEFSHCGNNSDLRQVRAAVKEQYLPIVAVPVQHMAILSYSAAASDKRFQVMYRPNPPRRGIQKVAIFAEHFHLRGRRGCATGGLCAWLGVTASSVKRRCVDTRSGRDLVS